MIRQGNAIVTEFVITPLPPAPLHALEIWSNPIAVAERFASAGLRLPERGRSAGGDETRFIRFEPTVWLVEGKIEKLSVLLGEDGALTAVGGGIVRVRLSGPGWRSLLMEGGVLDAESEAFAPGSSATTLIDHVNVRLWVEGIDACIAYVPLSYSADLIHFWKVASATLV